jgi:hypothetical protein
MFAVVPIHAYDVKNASIQKVGQGICISIVTDAKDYKDFAIEESERIIVDFENSLCHLAGTISSPHLPLLRIRSSQYKVEPVPITRVVLDLQLKTPYSISRWSKGIRIHVGQIEDTLTGIVPELPESRDPESKTVKAKTLEPEVPKEKTPKTKTPEVKTPEVKTPEVKTPEVKAPEVKAPEVKAPEVKALEVKALEVKALEVKALEVKALEVKALEIDLPVTDSSVSKPPESGLKVPEPPALFFYNARQKRDPFRPYLGTPAKDTLLDVATTTIVGIMWSPSEKYALAEDGSGKAFILEEGNQVSSGVVSKIRKKDVVFLIRVFGGTRKVILKIAPKKEKE